jgi:hypothetical protein
MNEEQTKNQMGGQHPEGCKCDVCQGKTCGMCGMGGGYMGRHSCWYHVIRWILGLAIILIVFSFGVMIGELKGELSNSGYRMMRSYNGGYGQAYPMRGGQDVQNVQGFSAGNQSQTAPSAQVVPTTNK